MDSNMEAPNYRLKALPQESNQPSDNERNTSPSHKQRKAKSTRKTSVVPSRDGGKTKNK
jgi:hypothetical protein